MSKTIIASALAAALSGAPLVAAAAAAAGGHDLHHATQTESAAPAATGEVRKIDMDQKKITIRHGPLENLGMPPMTMVFQVSDPALLAAVKAGDKVRFMAENKGGALVITRMERE